MSDDKLEFLDEKEPEAPEQEEAQASEEAEPEKVEAEPAKEPEAKEEPEPTGEETTPPVEEPKTRDVPITAMLDEREKRQKAERDAEEARKMAEAANARLQELMRDMRKDEAKAPDFFEDPDQRMQFETKRIYQDTQSRLLQQSKFLAEREYGPDVVEKAIAFYDENPQLSHQFLDHPSPFHAAVDFYKKQAFLNEVSDPETWREQERAKIREEVMAEIKTPSKPKAPPASLANAPAAGNDAITPGNAFDGVFGE